MRSLITVATFVSLFASAGQGQTELLRSDSRAPYVHRISLYDHDGEVISPGDADGRPYSPIATCGKCHEVGKVAGGWHVNANHAGVDPGRPGEPWIYSEPALGVQIPISARGWEGTFTPRQIGLSDWDFVKRFGGHTPGGGLGDPAPDATSTADTAVPPGTASSENSTADTAVAHDDADRSLRWDISGALEIDCMICHSADQTHDPAETARQIEQENYKWAPTAALGLGVVRGAARKLPDDFDPWMGPDPDRPDLTSPTVVYDARRFDPDDRVFFNVTRRPSPDRCYFCHSFRQVGSDAPEAWHGDGDVHLRSGMTCVDCHRNGIDHMITRGYEGEPATREHPESQTLTCRGCHLGEGSLWRGPDGKSGRLGAPYPEHKGMPLVHFEKLRCTACHSGPWPENAAKRFQTAMNHGLGLPTRERTDADSPTILGPIFARDTDGRIAPHRMIWPAYWGLLIDGTITPITLDHVVTVFTESPPSTHSETDGSLEARGAQSEPEAPARTPMAAGPERDALAKPIALAQSEIAIALFAFSTQALDGEPVYIHNGRVHRLADGQLTSEVNAAAKPYLWAIGHDVRPAAQSLGVRGCTDCHAPDAPIYFGGLAATGEAGAEQRPVQVMHELRGDDVEIANLLATMFQARTAFKVFGFICAGILGLVLVRHGLAGIGARTEP